MEVRKGHCRLRLAYEDVQSVLPSQVLQQALSSVRLEVESAQDGMSIPVSPWRANRVVIIDDGNRRRRLAALDGYPLGSTEGFVGSSCIFVPPDGRRREATVNCIRGDQEQVKRCAWSPRPYHRKAPNTNDPRIASCSNYCLSMLCLLKEAIATLFLAENGVVVMLILPPKSWNVVVSTRYWPSSTLLCRRIRQSCSTVDH